MAETIGPTGIKSSDVDELVPTIRQTYKGLQDLRKLGQLPYRDLPYQEEHLENVRNRAEAIRTEYDNLLILGTGGSSLGAGFLLQALTPLAPSKQLKIEICEDLQPLTWKRICERFSEGKTFLLVLSKSGKTIETLAAFLFFRKWLIDRGGETAYRQGVLFVTDPKKGPLRGIAAEEKIETLPVPPGVGGRYSVLSTVGLLPAACGGVNIRLIMEGARRMDQRCQREDVWMNPAVMSAVLHFLADRKGRKRIRVIMPYEILLRSYAGWFAQLWAESLGKQVSLKGEPIRAGSTPVQAYGSLDQHSQLQLYLDGPQDKIVNFLAVEHPIIDYKVPRAYQNYPEFSMLAEQSIYQLLTIQRLATEAALRQAGCPNLTIRMREVNPYTIGQLLYMAEVETVFAGALYDINPFDQPGVELIKNFIRGLLRVEDFLEYRRIIEASKKDPRFTI